MSKHPHFTAKTVRKHPATITQPEQLRSGMELATGYVIPSINRRQRLAQAGMGAINHAEGVRASWNAKKAYNHTPNWGIVVESLVQIQAVRSNGNDPRVDCLLLRCERSGLITKAMGYIARSIEDVANVAYKLPPEVVMNEDYEMVKGPTWQVLRFIELGLGTQPKYDYQLVAFDLSKISGN